MIHVVVWKPGKEYPIKRMTGRGVIVDAVATSSLGHAAMVCHSGQAGKKFYVTWYPSEEIGFAAVTHQEKCTSPKVFSSFKEEREQEWGGAAPDLFVHLKGLEEDKDHGLDEDQIKKTWEDLQKNEKWCLYRHNCSTIVYHLLVAAGAPEEGKLTAVAVSKEEDSLLADAQKAASKMDLLAKDVWTPIRLYNYANALAQYINQRAGKKK